MVKDRDGLLAEDEQVLLHRRPHWSTAVRLVLDTPLDLLVRLVRGVILDVAVWQWSGAQRAVELVAVPIGMALAVLGDVLDWWDTRYLVTTRRVIVRRDGEVTAIALHQIRWLRTTRTTMLGSGTLVVGSATHTVVFDDIARVRDVERLLNRLTSS